MKEYKPADDFVARVMENVQRYEGAEAIRLNVTGRLFASRLFRYAMSGGGIFVGIFLAPVACI